MGATIVARAILFLSSYAPLFVILGLRDSFGSQIAQYALVGLAILSVLFLGVFLLVVRSQNPLRVKVSQARSMDVEAISYIVTYLLPFLDVSFRDPAGAASLGVILLVIAVIYVHSSMIHINPILSLMGFHILEVTAESGKPNVLITRRAYIRPGSEIKASPAGDYLLLERES